MSQSGLGRRVSARARRAGALRVVEVDARPLDTLVQRSIAQAAMKEPCAVESCGRVHVFEMGALSLGAGRPGVDLPELGRRAVWLRDQGDDLGQGELTTRTLMIKEPELIGEYLAFERFMPSHTGVPWARCATHSAAAPTRTPWSWRRSSSTSVHILLEF